MNRYEQLLKLIDIFQPQSIAEIGTWNGKNAIRMIKQAKAHNDNVIYLGYDLFEDANDTTDKEELNVKPHYPVETVRQEIERGSGATEVNLVKGNTRETLKPISADFCFIDGGHSLQTIASDYENCKYSTVIVLDDYYVPDEAGNMPDTNLYGCNKLVAGMKNAIILPVKDPVKGGGYTQIVLVLGDK